MGKRVYSVPKAFASTSHSSSRSSSRSHSSSNSHSSSRHSSRHSASHSDSNSHSAVNSSSRSHPASHSSSHSSPRSYHASHQPAQSSSSKRRHSRPSARKDTSIDVYEEDQITNLPAADPNNDGENYELNEMDFNSENDEEIDEDLAFDEEDEDRWGDYFNSQPSKKVVGSDKKGKRKLKDEENSNDILLDEDEAAPGENDEEPSDFEDDPEAVDISEMLNDQAKPTFTGFMKPDSFKMLTMEPEKSTSTSIPFDLLDGEEDDMEMSESDDDMLDRTTASVMNKLDQSNSENGTKRRKVKHDYTQAYEESEYNVNPTLDANGNEVLTMESLLNDFAEEDGFNQLQKQFRSMTKEKKQQETLVPIPTHLKTKLERETAYIQTKSQVSKWLPLVQKNRQADHLVFPMDQEKNNVTKSSLAGTLKPSTGGMEEEIDAILRQSGMRSEKDIIEAENLAFNAINPEEVKKQRAEMAKLRALLFYHEQKAKRASKIKSKSYRRLKRKEKERKAMTLEQLKEMDPDFADEDIMERERRRAEERVSLRHKNGGKWGKKMARFNVHDTETRESVTEKLQRHDELMKKIQGQSSDSEVDSDSDPEVTRQKLQEMAEELDEKPEPMVKGVMGMKFMQKALEAERQEAKKRILDMQREFEEEAALGEELDALEEGKALPSQPIAVVRNNNPGRMQFGPTSTKSKSVDKGEKDEYYDRSSDDDDEQPATTEGSATARIVNLDHGVQVDEFNKSASKKISVSGPIDIGSIPLNTPMLNPPSDSKKISFSTFTSPAVETENNDDMIKQVDTVDDEDNPWMAPIDGLSGLSTLANTAGSRKYDETDHQRAAKSKQKMLKNVLKQEKKQQQEVLDQLESAIPEETMDGSDDSNDEITHVASRNQISFFSQKELIQMAFANDDVLEQEFMNEKEAIMDADAPKGVDVTLPGWGSWGGVDAPQPRKRFVLPPKPGAIDPSKRKDKPLKHVIINEQMDKKMTQYMCQKVPFPYKSREQYEAMMRNPVGKEWNAAHVFSKQIKPRILTKMGATIAPPKFVKIEKE